VEIVPRDRSTEYKAGIDAGAPQAIQIADRWHLLKNLRDMLERFLQSIRAELQALPIAEAHQVALAPQRSPFYRTRRERAAAQASRERRLAQYTHIQQLRRDGYNITQIAQLLGLNRKTVSKYYHARTFPERNRRSPGRSLLDPYLPYLAQRFDAGCQNALQLWRELQDQGFTGSSKQVSRWVQTQRTHSAPQTLDKHWERLDIRQDQPQHALPTVRSLAWLLVRDPKDLSDDEIAILQHLQQHPLLAQVYQLARQFVVMIHNRDAPAFDSWLATCVAVPVTQVQHFALGLQQDYTAVKAALRFEWSNGQTEGHVNRLKCIKRQMYGRANFDLLRLHVLGPP
jgi:transposase